MEMSAPADLAFLLPQTPEEPGKLHQEVCGRGRKEIYASVASALKSK
jgi:hypothetical protein